MIVQPSILNGPTVYNTGAGGGGGGDSVLIGSRYYKTIKIGSQTWLAENLEFNYQNCIVGGSVSNADPRANLYQNNGVYSLDSDRKCGYLYNKKAGLDISSLVDGWHLPTRAECQSLIDFCGNDYQASIKLRGDDIQWASSFNGSNETKFNALPNGYRASDNTFYSVTEEAYFIISDGSVFLHISTSAANFTYYENTMQGAIRLIKD